MSGGTASQYRPDGERSEARGDSNLGGARGIEAVRTHAGGLMLRGLFLASVIAAAIGGWAVITVEQLPDYVTAGRPVTLSFTVRQHGVTRLSGLKPSIEARSGDLTTTATASPGRETGQYASTLGRPRADQSPVADGLPEAIPRQPGDRPAERHRSNAGPRARAARDRGARRVLEHGATGTPVGASGPYGPTGSPLGTAAGMSELRSRAAGSVKDLRNATRSRCSSSVSPSGRRNRKSSVWSTALIVASSPWYSERSSGASCATSYVRSASVTSL